MSFYPIPQIEAWKPGMGINCTRMNAGNNKSFACGPPVARVPMRKYSTVRSETVIARADVLCLNHLASHVISLRSRSRGAGLSGDATKRAREELIVKHWEEYQRLLDKHVDEVSIETMSQLPDSLREQVLDLHQTKTHQQ